mmetsp:Transcript_30856/g.64481  ORF Transcript_30856/g.64481 Transcript_30856/m.64481 type:complete len:84 (-) Transcript_30856:119-370(-)
MSREASFLRSCFHSGEIVFLKPSELCLGGLSTKFFLERQQWHGSVISFGRGAGCGNRHDAVSPFHLISKAEHVHLCFENEMSS